MTARYPRPHDGPGRPPADARAVRVGAGLALVAALGFGTLGIRGKLAGAVGLGVGLLYAAATALYFAALGRITAGTTSLPPYLAPAFVILFGALAGRWGSPRRGWSWGCRGRATRPYGAGPRRRGGALYALYLLASERWLPGAPPLASTGHMALVSAVFFAGLGVGAGELRVPDTPRSGG